ncbi:uncharacterized protein LOC133080876 [Eubalaena glacialis]|uniref:uncharacterized protein LOC133080876 n=1 Tax=Eubalaena glacialis TaxID=27606 RepID=UPI002A5990EF|nr:uncharacterized protein LOC133080876 [Eubalaena glacialis]
MRSDIPQADQATPASPHLGPPAYPHPGRPALTAHVPTRGLPLPAWESTGGQKGPRAAASPVLLHSCRGCPTGDLVKTHEAQEQHGLACQGAQEESQPWGQPPTPPFGRTSSSRTWPPALEGLRRAQLPSPLLPFQRLKGERSLSHRPPGRDAPCQSIQTRHMAMELVAQLQHSRAPHHPSAQGARSPHQGCTVEEAGRLQGQAHWQSLGL